MNGDRKNGGYRGLGPTEGLIELEGRRQLVGKSARNINELEVHLYMRNERRGQNRPLTFDTNRRAEDLVDDDAIGCEIVVRMLHDSVFVGEAEVIRIPNANGNRQGQGVLARTTRRIGNIVWGAGARGSVRLYSFVSRCPAYQWRGLTPSLLGSRVA